MDSEKVIIHFETQQEAIDYFYKLEFLWFLNRLLR